MILNTTYFFLNSDLQDIYRFNSITESFFKARWCSLAHCSTIPQSLSQEAEPTFQPGFIMFLGILGNLFDRHFEVGGMLCSTAMMMVQKRSLGGGHLDRIVSCQQQHHRH